MDELREMNEEKNIKEEKEIRVSAKCQPMKILEV
jgi:hypothetical protein